MYKYKYFIPHFYNIKLKYNKNIILYYKKDNGTEYAYSIHL